MTVTPPNGYRRCDHTSSHTCVSSARLHPTHHSDKQVLRDNARSTIYGSPRSPLHVVTVSFSVLAIGINSGI